MVRPSPHRGRQPGRIVGAPVGLEDAFSFLSVDPKPVVADLYTGDCVVAAHLDTDGVSTIFEGVGDQFAEGLPDPGRVA